MEAQSTRPGTPMAGALLLWLVAFSAWERVAKVSLDWKLVSRHWLTCAACAVVTVALFAYLAAKPPGRRHLAAWGMGAALVMLWFALWGGCTSQPQALVNLALLCALFSAGWFIGEAVDSTAYVVPMLFAGAVDAALRTWAGPWLAATAPAGTHESLWFPLLGSRGVVSVFSAGELLFLAVFVTAIERMGLGLSRGCMPAIVSLLVFCAMAGAQTMAAARSPLMVLCFSVTRIRRLSPDPQPSGAPILFGLAFAGLMVLLAFAGGLVQCYEQLSATMR